MTVLGNGSLGGRAPREYIKEGKTGKDNLLKGNLSEDTQNRLRRKQSKEKKRGEQHETKQQVECKVGCKNKREQSTDANTLVGQPATFGYIGLSPSWLPGRRALRLQNWCPIGSRV